MTSDTDAVKTYFDAWNDHNAEAILDSLTPDGTYSDPVGGENLSGQAYAAYANSLFTAFPDLIAERECSCLREHFTVQALRSALTCESISAARVFHNPGSEECSYL